jgi:hypothetical protein
MPLSRVMPRKLKSLQHKKMKRARIRPRTLTRLKKKRSPCLSAI